MARKASVWAKAAGEYFRKNKGKNGIESFSDVLKSNDFKKEYYAKYGKQGKTMAKKQRKGKMTKKNSMDIEEITGGEGEVALPGVPEKTDAPSPPMGGGETPVPIDTSTDTATAITTPSVPVTGGKRKTNNKKRTVKKSLYKLW
jgi:hypothetical protein